MTILGSLIFIFSFSFSESKPQKFDNKLDSLILKIKSYGAKSGYIDTTLSDSKRYYAFKNMENQKTQQAYGLDFSNVSPFVSVTCFSCMKKDMPPLEHALCKKEFTDLYRHVYGVRPDLSKLKLEVTSNKEFYTASENGQVRSRLRENFRCKTEGLKGYEYTLFVTPN